MESPAIVPARARSTWRVAFVSTCLLPLVALGTVALLIHHQQSSLRGPLRLAVLACLLCAGLSAIMLGRSTERPLREIIEIGLATFGALMALYVLVAIPVINLAWVLDVD